MVAEAKVVAVLAAMVAMVVVVVVVEEEEAERVVLMALMFVRTAAQSLGVMKFATAAGKSAC